MRRDSGKRSTAVALGKVINAALNEHKMDRQYGAKTLRIGGPNYVEVRKNDLAKFFVQLFIKQDTCKNCGEHISNGLRNQNSHITDHMISDNQDK